jgi:hypothetical protein
MEFVGVGFEMTRIRPPTAGGSAKQNPRSAFGVRGLLSGGVRKI